MPHTYLQDVEQIIAALRSDEGLILEEKLILLNLMADHIAQATKELEDELPEETDGEGAHTPE